MEFLQFVLRILQTEVQEPELYGWYHIMCLGLTALVTVMLCVFHKKDKPERVRLVVLFTTLFVIAFEIYKQIVFSFSVTDSGIEFEYLWYAFPFQFCSTPMYIGLLAGLTKKGRLHDACSAYLATYAIFAGICVMLYPGDVFMYMMGINIQTMICHGSMIAIGIYLLYTQHVKLQFKTIFKAMAVFSSCLVIAMILNEVAHLVGITEDNTFNMFFVSPYFDSTLPVFSLVQPHVPFIVGLVLYVGVFSLFAFAILSAAIGIKSFCSKHEQFAAFFQKVGDQVRVAFAAVVSKKYRGLKIASAVMASFILFMAAVNIVTPPKNVEANPFVIEEDELPMIAAHRGGGECNPENTMLAFREAVKTYNVDVIESDLYLTKDGYLVYNHDAYIDDTCNINGDMTLEEVKELCEDEENRHYIEDMTLAELQQYNFGYYFTDEDGEYIYRDVTDLAAHGLQITTVDKLFAEFYESHPDLLFIVEIKDSGERGTQACEVLYEALEDYPEYKDRIVVGTFHDEIEDELSEEYPDLLRGAPTGTAAKFILTQYFGVNIFDDGSFACLQIPMSYDLGIEIPLDESTLVERAHRRNIAVQYWTINEEEDMRRLIELGVDCIMTDNPELLSKIIEEYRQKAREAEASGNPSEDEPSNEDAKDKPLC